MKKVLLSILALFCSVLLSGSLLAQGTLEEVRVMGVSLQGNLEGDDPERSVFVYLPPGYAANPANAPYYFDWPFKDGAAQPIVQGRWTANSPVVFVGQYAPALKSFKAIQLDVGDKDGLINANNQLVEQLTQLGITHGYEVYDGDHGNRVGQRFIDEVLPFFEQHLQP